MHSPQASSPRVWTIPHRILLGLASTVALSLLAAGLALFELRQIARTTKFMSVDPYPGTVAIYEIECAAGEYLAMTLRALSAPAAQRAAALEKAAIASGHLDRALHDYDVTMTMDEDKKMFADLTARTTALRAAVVAGTRTLETAQAADALQESAQQILARFEPLRDKVRSMEEWNRRNAETALADIDRSVAEGHRFTVAGGILAIALGALVSWLLIRGIKTQLHDIADSLLGGAGQVASASSQLSGTSQTLAGGATQQASSLEECSATLTEISAVAGRNATSTSRAKALAIEARTAATAGVGQMAAMREAMQDIKTSSDEVAKIVRTIDEIAFQTNILALNAAVEAARAGAAGTGFSVVADEVRSLAQRSAGASRETAAKIESAIARTLRGVQSCETADENLRLIEARSRSVDELIGEVSAANEEQSAQVRAVTTAIEQIDQVVQGNAAAAEESSASAEELNQQASSLHSAVEHLALLSGSGLETASARNHSARSLKSPRHAARALGAKNGIFRRPALA